MRKYSTHSLAVHWVIEKYSTHSVVVHWVIVEGSDLSGLPSKYRVFNALSFPSSTGSEVS